MNNTERDPKNYHFPESIYTPEIEAVKQAPLKDSTYDQLTHETELAQVRQQVEEAYLVVKPSSEQINEQMIDQIGKRGQEIKQARDLYLADNPSRLRIQGQPFYKKIAFRALNGLLESASEKDLIEEESVIGADIFKIDGFRFFNTDANNWWAHYGQNSTRQVEPITVHYEILPMGILKSSSEDSRPNEFLGYGPELNNLDKATDLYHQRIIQKYNYVSKIIPNSQINSSTSEFYSLDSDKKAA